MDRLPPIEPSFPARAWLVSLTHKQRGMVACWLATNPPPSGWLQSSIDWAFTEMPDPASLFGRLTLWLGAL